MELDLREIELIEKTEGIDLNNLGLSVRLYNCLKRGGYNTLTDIMLELPDKFTKIRNFGRTSEQELFALRNFVLSADRDSILQYCENRSEFGLTIGNGGDGVEDTFTVLENVLNRRIELPEVMFINDEGDYCTDININELHISVRTINVLMANGLDSILKVTSFQYQDLLKLKGMGQKSISELLEALKNKTIISETTEDINNDAVNEAVNSVLSFFASIIDVLTLDKKRKEITAVVIRVCEDSDAGLSLNEDKMTEIARHNPINYELRQIILSAVSDKIYFGLDKRTLITIVSNHNSQYYAIFNETIESMISDKQIRIISGKVYKYKVFLDEWISTLGGSYKIALECRCQGMTLEKTGVKLDLTRERVRQLVAKALEKRPPIYEDDYVEFIEKYYFTKEEFTSLFSLTPEQINYLLLSYKRGNGDVQAFLDDASVPGYFKERVAATFRGKVLVLDGECIPLKRDILMQKLLKTFYSDKECSVEEFTEFYESFLEENNIADYENLLFPNRRALEARITDYPYTIAKMGHKIRYYDTDSVDINMLLEAMDISRYDGTEISTLKLVRDWPEVMDQYDIRDEYELHNLIRKKINEIKKYDITVTRMPFISLGGDRNKQVEDILLQLAPISNIELAKEYEERYGVRSETVLANFFKRIDVFYHDGIFDLEQQDLSSDDYKVLKSTLIDDFYLWDTIVKIYHDISRNPNPEAINAMTLKKLGFRVYSQYIISAEYQSADAFFTEMLLKNQSICLEELPHGVRTIQAYYSVLTELRDSLELIEVDKDIFYRYDFFAEQYGIESKEKLAVIGAEIIKWLDEKEYFSIDAIAIENNIELGNEISWNPYILNSVIRVQPDIKTSRIANTYVGTKKENDLSQIGIITYLIETYGEMSIGALIDLLKSKYCLHLEKSRILYVIEESDRVIHDDIFDYICKRSEWNGYDGPVYLLNTRYAQKIEENLDCIEQSNELIAKVYWRDKYTEFVDYCGMNDCFEMEDILKLDFAKLYDNASRLNISRGTIADVANMFIEWASSFSVDASAEEDSGSILDLFFK